LVSVFPADTADKAPAAIAIITNDTTANRLIDIHPP
jgi:hypothetical protein